MAKRHVYLLTVPDGKGCKVIGVYSTLENARYAKFVYEDTTIYRPDGTHYSRKANDIEAWLIDDESWFTTGV